MPHLDEEYCACGEGGGGQKTVAQGVWGWGGGRTTKDISCCDRVWMQGFWRDVLWGLFWLKRTKLKVASEGKNLISLEDTEKCQDSNDITCFLGDGSTDALSLLEDPILPCLGGLPPWEDRRLLSHMCGNHRERELSSSSILPRGKDPDWPSLGPMT